MSAFSVPPLIKSTETRIFFSILVILTFFLNPIPYSKAKGHIKSTQIWLESGSFVVPEVPQQVLERTKDTDLSDYYGEYGERDGRIYPKYPPGTNVLLAPLDLVARQLTFLAEPMQSILPNEEPEVVMVNCMGALVWTASSVAALGVLIWWATGFVCTEPRLRLATVALTVFGTILFYHGTGLYTKPISCAWTFAAFVMLWRLKVEKKYGGAFAALAGFLVGFSVAVDYQVGVTLLLISAYAAWVLPWRQTALFLVGAAVPIAGLLLFHWVVIGHPFATTYSLAYGHRESAGLGWPRWEAIYGLTVSLERGVIWYMPAIFLGIAGMVYARRRSEWHAELVFCALVILGHLAFNFCANDWRSGAGYGPRYLIYVIPFAMMWAPITFTRWPRWASALIGTVSVCVSYLGTQAYFIPIAAPSQLGAAVETFYSSGGSATRIWRWLLAPGWTAATGVEDAGLALVLISHLLTLLAIALWLYLMWRRWPAWRTPQAPTVDA